MGEFTAGPVHYDQDSVGEKRSLFVSRNTFSFGGGFVSVASLHQMGKGDGGSKNLVLPINIPIDVGKELGQLNRQRLETIAQLIQLLDNDGRARQIARPHALAQVPHGHARRLQVAHLRDAILRVVDERLEAARDAGDLDEVGDGPSVGGLEEGAGGGHGDQADEQGDEERGPGLGHGAVGVANQVDGGLDGLGALLDFGADGEADVCLWGQGRTRAHTHTRCARIAFWLVFYLLSFLFLECAILRTRGFRRGA